VVPVEFDGLSGGCLRAVYLQVLADHSDIEIQDGRGGAFIRPDSRGGGLGGGLPAPFVPAYVKYEDGLFNYCLQACHDGIISAQLPFCLFHAPNGRGGSLSTSARRSRLFHVLLSCLSASVFGRPKLAPAVRMRRLGERPIDFGTCSPSAFREFVSCALWDCLASVVYHK
jgi:hypothetical protein